MAIETLGQYTVEIRKDTTLKNLYYFTATVGEDTTSGQALGFGQAMVMASDRAYEIMERKGQVK